MLAIVGDVHGHHHRMVAMLNSLESKKGIKINSVLQVGDFEAHRNEEDLSTMAAPQKYRKLGDFHQYHSGIYSFPWPVTFIGGNHEPYGWYDREISGFETATNCFYMGRTGLKDICGFRVVGISGIYAEPKFSSFRPDVDLCGTVSNKEFIYYNEQDIEKALEYERCDILMVHDWPMGIISKDDYPYFQGRRRSLNPEEIGCEYTFMVMEMLKPKIVACGHMHFKYFSSLNIKGNNTRVCCLANVESGSDSVVILDNNLQIIA